MGQVSPGQYGLVVWDDQGREMWNFSTGAQTRGIGPNAVTEGLLYSSVGNITVTTSETELASLTYGVLNPGDQVWLSATVTGIVSVGGPLLAIRLREDSIVGNEWHRSDKSTLGYSSMSVQAVFTASNTLSPKRFVVTIQNVLTGDNVGAQFISFVGLRRQR
jgi:hypothetical protein